MSGLGMMGGEYRLGKPFGIPLTINTWLVVLIAGIFGFALLSKQPLDGAWIVVIFVSILLHEWAHALTAKVAGDTVFKVQIHLLGGATYRAGRGGPRWDFRITAAGPLTNVALGGGAWLALHFAGHEMPMWATFILSQVFWINGILAVFNLLPIHPMDGGRLARIALAKRVGAAPGARIALGLSFVVLILTVGFFGATNNLNLITIVLLGQLFMLNVMETRQVGRPSMAETRVALGNWWRGRAERSAERKAKRARREEEEARGSEREPSPFGRAKTTADRDEEVLRDGGKVLERAGEKGLGALSSEERHLLMLHRRLIEIRVDTAAGEPDKGDLELLEKHVRLGASGEVH